MRQRIAIVIAALVIPALTGGCSNQPSLSGGIGLLTQHVTSGDELTLRLPQAADKPTWRVTSFDSAMVRPIGQARREQTGENRWVTIITFMAKLEGSTKIEVSNGLEFKTFSVRVVPKM